jgi:hypothetical protein
MKGKRIITIILAFLSVLIGVLLFSQIGSGQQKDRGKRYYNKSNKEIVYIGNADENVGMANFSNTEAKKVAFIGSGGNNHGHASFYNRNGRKVAYIGASTRGNGMVEIDGKKVHDYAEVFELATRQEVIPGTVMSMVNSGVGLAPSTEPYDPKVVGVISGAGGFSPGMRMGTRKDGSNDLPIAVNGQVYVRVCLEGGSIEVGDLLVSSSQTGVAMRATDHGRAFGAVIGKALEPYNGNPTGSEEFVRMLVMSR